MCSTCGQAPGLMTRLERTTRDKHSSLLQIFVTYGCKKFYESGSWTAQKANIAETNLKQFFCNRGLFLYRFIFPELRKNGGFTRAISESSFCKRWHNRVLKYIFFPSWWFVDSKVKKLCKSKGLFTRPISERDFAVSQSLLQNIIFFLFYKMGYPTAKSDSRVNRPLMRDLSYTSVDPQTSIDKIINFMHKVT